MPSEGCPNPRIIDETVATLRAWPIFDRVDEPALRDLVARSTRRIYRAGQTILDPEDRPTAIWAFLSGRARLFRPSPEGRMVELQIFSTGDVAPLELLTEAGAWSCGLEAMSDRTTTLAIPLAWFRRFVESHPSIALTELDRAARQLTRMDVLAEDLGLYHLRAQLAHALLRLSDASGRDTVSITHQDLAQTFGARREEVTKALGHLRREGLIQGEAGRIRILSREGLASI